MNLISLPTTAQLIWAHILLACNWAHVAPSSKLKPLISFSSLHVIIHHFHSKMTERFLVVTKRRLIWNINRSHLHETQPVLLQPQYVRISYMQKNWFTSEGCLLHLCLMTPGTHSEDFFRLSFGPPVGVMNLLQDHPRLVVFGILLHKHRHMQATLITIRGSKLRPLHMQSIQGHQGVP